MEKIVIQIPNGITVYHIPAVEKNGDVYIFAENNASPNLDGCVIHKGLGHYDVSGLQKLWRTKEVLGKYALCTPDNEGWNSVHFEPITLPEDIKKILCEIRADFNSNGYPDRFTLGIC